VKFGSFYEGIPPPLKAGDEAPGGILLRHQSAAADFLTTPAPVAGRKGFLPARKKGLNIPVGDIRFGRTHLPRYKIYFKKVLDITL